MRRAAWIMAVAWAGCAPDLAPEGTPDAGAPDAAITVGETTITIDATETGAWRYLDLESGELVVPADPVASGAWDLGLSRFSVITNGGVSGTGGCAAARIDAGWDEVTRAPEDGWIADAPDGALDDDTGPDTAFNGGAESANDWYDYDPSTHRLTPKADLVFVVRTVEGAFFKLQILDYYDAAGTPAILRLRFAQITGAEVVLPDAGTPPPPPDAAIDGGGSEIPTDALTIDASDREQLVYLRVSDGVVTVADPATSSDWDLALRRTVVRTNSGTSGPGLGGALGAGVVALESVTSTDTIGFAVDAIAEGGAPGSTPESVSPVLGGWFDYDPLTHTVTPRADVWIVRTARGEYARLRIWDWRDGVFRLSLDPIEVAPAAHSIEVDASSSDAWAHVDLHAAQTVAVDDAGSDARWDLGLSRTLLRTSSGTSGPGEGGAIDTGVPDPASVVAIPDTGWVVDELRAIPGPPGSPEISSNGALEGWYDYDPATHAVTPRATTFLVRLADGSAGRLRITGWVGGRFTLEWTYAGPGRSSL